MAGTKLSQDKEGPANVLGPAEKRGLKVEPELTSPRYDSATKVHRG